MSSSSAETVGPGVLRTPEHRFAALPDWPYAPRYLDLDGLRLHLIDEGPRDAPATVLCLHGQPTWSYLYRRMIPVFLQAGLRVVAPDFFGFGRSDKPVDDAWYTFDQHRDTALRVIESLDLQNILLVVQDWGGLIGLTLPMAMPQRFTRLLVMNTGLGTGTVTEGFRQWRAYANTQPDLAVGKLIRRGTPHLTDAEVAAYDAPFPDARHKAGVRRFPNLVPDHDDAPGAAISREALDFWKHRWAGDSFMAIGMQDPVLGPPAMRGLHAVIRGCPPPMEVADAGHFVQEWGAPVAAAALQHFELA
ncbi:MAG: alpha/beta fold hydrolase [Burkholderiaceae bacterium]|nr:alpha/beta fold hydrolase [Burkholderiaceae bacterium]